MTLQHGNFYIEEEKGRQNVFDRLQLYSEVADLGKRGITKLCDRKKNKKKSQDTFDLATV